MNDTVEQEHGWDDTWSRPAAYAAFGADPEPKIPAPRPPSDGSRK